jgi:hypothetical protein
MSKAKINAATAALTETLRKKIKTSMSVEHRHGTYCVMSKRLPLDILCTDDNSLATAKIMLEDFCRRYIRNPKKFAI